MAMAYNYYSFYGGCQKSIKCKCNFKTMTIFRTSVSEMRQSVSIDLLIMNKFVGALLRVRERHVPSEHGKTIDSIKIMFFS